MATPNPTNTRHRPSVACHPTSMSRPPLNPDQTAAGIAVDPHTLERVIPESRRPDGTYVVRHTELPSALKHYSFQDPSAEKNSSWVHSSGRRPSVQRH